MDSDPGDAQVESLGTFEESVKEHPGTPWEYPESDAPSTAELAVDADGVVDLSALREAATAAADVSEEEVSLEEILWQYRHAILDLHHRVGELEKRPQFAASVRGRSTGH